MQVFRTMLQCQQIKVTGMSNTIFIHLKEPMTCLFEKKKKINDVFHMTTSSFDTLMSKKLIFG